MRVQTTPTRARRLAQGIAGLNVVLLLAGFALGLVLSGRLVNDVRSVAAVVYSVLAVLIIARNPRHTVGWLFLAVGFFSALGELGNGLQYVEPYLNFGLLRNSLMLVIGLAWIPAFMIPISLVLLYFPDGRLPARRWWPIPAAMLMGMFGYGASLVLHPWPWPAQEIFDTYNPFAIPGSEDFLELTTSISIGLVAIGITGSLAALVVRFFRSKGIERVQMKWLVYTAMVGILLLFSLQNRSGLYNTIASIVFLSLPTVFALAIGIAILRYRLFDIDLIIRRTLIYSVLTGLLALVYFGSVVALQNLLRVFTSNEQNQFITVISTLAIAALFVPLRSRVQAFIDRRFYRRKYDAARTLAGFSGGVRDEVELEQLSSRLVEVVQNTMQPAHVSLWLKPPSLQLYARGEHLTH